MNRYVYYLIFINMIANLVATVPRILVVESKNGVLFSMGLAAISGVIITFITVKCFNNFPGQDLIELLKTRTPKWFSVPVLLYFALNWFIAGLITLVTFTFILIRFLSPETSIFMYVLSFLVIISYGVLAKTKSVLYMTELTVVLFSPFVFLLIVKSYVNDVFNMDFVKVALMHANEWPSYSAYTASTYLYIGIVNLVVFNRYLTEKIRFGAKQIIIIGVVGAFVLLTTYFVPIGIAGFDEIDRLIYPWISTSDSIRMRFGIVERLLFIFLLIFLAIAVLSIVIHWHVAVKFFYTVFTFKKLKWKDKPLSPVLILILFWSVGIYMVSYLTEHQLFIFTSYFFNLLPLFFTVLIIVFFVIKRGVKG
ncbi:GerAB/ArcD/ProY family transporter [Sporosarcina sp. ITBMC105]